MKQKRYDRAFREHAVNLWLASGKSAREVAAELQIKMDRLYTWKQALHPKAAALAEAGRPGQKRRPEELEAEVARLQRENEYLRQQRDILKKTLGILSEDPPERFQRIELMKKEYSVRRLCQALEVSPSAFYQWRARQSHPSARVRENLALSQDVRKIFEQSHQRYGSPRIQQALRHQGQRHGRNRIARLMRQHRLCARARRRFRVATTDSRHAHPIAPNRLAESPAPQRPDQIWVADITYIPTQEGWLYLAANMDLYSRKIVGWAMSASLDTDLVLASWNMAREHRQPAAALMLHSDRGCQYASSEFRLALSQAQAVASMSRKGNCYDNAAMESFWSTLKNELVQRCQFQTRAQACQAIFEYIEVFYNRQRLHSSLNYLSPVDFESKNN